MLQQSGEFAGNNGSKIDSTATLAKSTQRLAKWSARCRSAAASAGWPVSV
jgi:hypothetical protein